MSSAASGANLLDQMISELWPGIIVTHDRGDNKQAIWAHVAQDPIGRQPVGRLIMDTKGVAKPEFHILESAMISWCAKRQTPYQDIYNRGVASGKIIGKSRFALGTGTEKYRGLGGPYVCVELAPPPAPQVQTATLSNIAHLPVVKRAKV